MSLQFHCKLQLLFLAAGRLPIADWLVAWVLMAFRASAIKTEREKKRMKEKEKERKKEAELGSFDL